MTDDWAGVQPLPVPADAVQHHVLHERLLASACSDDNAAMPHSNTWREELAAGWRLLLTATIGCGLGAAGIVFYSFGLFVTPLQEALGWSRGQVTATMFYGSLGLVLAAPPLGYLLDRVGVRAVVLVAIPALSVMLFVLAQFDGSLQSFYALFFLTMVAGTGTTAILYTRAVAGSFDAMRGLALGITLVGPGAAAMLMPPFMQTVIAGHGWRAGFLVLAVLSIAAWPLVFCWLEPALRKRHASELAVPQGMGRRAALATRTFWTIVFGFGATAIACSALLVHLVPMLRDAGLDGGRAARIAALVGVGVIVGRIGIGWLIDRAFAPYVAAVIFLVTAGGCLLLAVSGVTMAPLAAFLIGFSLGAEVDLIAYLTSRYFGLRHYGFLYASVYACFWFGASLGPAIAGRLFDHYGNYDKALIMVVGLLVFGALTAVSLPRFSKPA